MNRRVIRRLAGLGLVAVGLAGGSSAQGATETTVDCGAGANLQAAINAAPKGAILDVSGTCKGTFMVGKNLVLKGVSAAILDGQRADTTLTVTTGTVRVTKMTITGGNAAEQGGGIANSGTLTLVRDTITGNAAGEIGSGIYNDGSVVMQRSAVTSNTNQDVSGYGIWNDGTMTIDRSVVSRHSNGGIANSGNLSIFYSTISNNHNMPEPGGLENFGTATIAFSTFANNIAGNASGGGLRNGGSVTIFASTFADNVADEGGGAIAGGATVAASIIAGNTDTSGLPDNCTGGVISQGYNLFGKDCASNAIATDLPATNHPTLRPLGSYGGPTQTILPGPASPTVNAIPIGAPGGLCPSSGTSDQREIARPQAGACDIGSVERKPKE